MRGGHFDDGRNIGDGQNFVRGNDHLARPFRLAHALWREAVDLSEAGVRWALARRTSVAGVWEGGKEEEEEEEEEGCGLAKEESIGMYL